MPQLNGTHDELPANWMNDILSTLTFDICLGQFGLFLFIDIVRPTGGRGVARNSNYSNPAPSSEGVSSNHQITAHWNQSRCCQR
jgi:hypothetical protein